MARCTEIANVSWDKELNRIYNLLMSNLTEKGKYSLKLSQRQWIKQRDLEFDFIDSMYNRKKFSGSMYIPIKVMDKLVITKSRVEVLSKYLTKHK